MAQRLADQCHFVHDDCRATTRYPFAGQTVGEARWATPTTGDGASTRLIESLRKIIDAWWSEKRYVTAEELMQPFKLYKSPPPWGHFSQLAVWSLQAIGCGAAYYGPSIKLLFVCDFSHTNMLGQRTLRPGPVIPCPKDTERNNSPYPLLCTTKKIQNEEQTNVDIHFTEESQYVDANSDSEALKIHSTSQNWNNIKFTTHFEEFVKTNKYHNFQIERTTEKVSSRGRWIWQEKEEISTRTTEKHHNSQFYIIERNRHDQDYQTTEETIRPKWQQTNTISRRPDPDYYTKHPMSFTRIIGIKMDDQIAEQLFKDTGFKIKNKEN